MLLSIIPIENEVARRSFNGLINEFAEKWNLKNYVTINQDISILIYRYNRVSLSIVLYKIMAPNDCFLQFVTLLVVT